MRISLICDNQRQEINAVSMSVWEWSPAVCFNVVYTPSTFRIHLGFQGNATSLLQPEHLPPASTQTLIPHSLCPSVECRREKSSAGGRLKESGGPAGERSGGNWIEEVVDIWGLAWEIRVPKRQHPARNKKQQKNCKNEDSFARYRNQLLQARKEASGTKFAGTVAA